ncbi:unnamed protein product [Rangifer tarandus platyrhynchus]|uniref:Uncharacterized protein n=2 Tax=Rangifer tarandus platyrhynchus TaxID=3082113 RepID=A0AC59Z0X4_RANTA|nr:unnamed protein product [Rangifer tarandus platyrhynchus]
MMCPLDGSVGRGMGAPVLGTRSVLTPPPRVLLSCSVWKLTSYVFVKEGFGLPPLPTYTPGRRSQLDSSAKCPSLVPGLSLGMASPPPSSTGHAGGGRLECQAGLG